MTDAGQALVDEAPRPTGEIATLRDGQHVDGVYACTRKERQISKSGAPYLTVELRDATGSITARAFRHADELAGHFGRGDLVRVTGTAQRFRDALQISIAGIERSSASDPAAFLPRTYRDVEELEGFFEHLAGEVYDPGLRGLLDALLADRELRTEMLRAPCAIPAQAGRPATGHHAYLGGLIEHTVAVATLAVDLCAVHPRLDRDLLVCAALLHDIGRAREFSYGAQIELTEPGRLLGHTELSLREIARLAPPTLGAERRLALEHCVLMHHGPDAAGGRRFQSAESGALYRLNALDAQVKAMFERGA